MTEYTKADAANRAWRTAFQGLIVTVLLAAASAVTGVLQVVNGTEGDVNWSAVAETAGSSVLTAVLMAGLAYAHRVWGQPPTISA